MINYILTVKFYISLNLPRKEDGNNFGVEVQSEIISNLSDSLDSARQVLSEMITYFATRASYIVSSRQNPHIADYMNGIATYDNKE
ncbi:uncharacterized protein [Blastocystis hominis]|uniref:Proteasome activator PA28 C-terminal domain-containing protein n=1 Tax=Blastocystis hominis TaxID=12968 RepID=D8LWY3_BLAHO|nr:uncharacterized protein [Blastocystis hominis]CBK20778.2 unnamed protein product [Blastocystis hominis]|eukprot:XP_012894826.1 uncharacterized protein [Blastocystis hominis]